MAERDSKRYYWLKLKKDFFQQHKMKILKSLPNGRLYAFIYLELLAESTSHNGELRFSEMLPYDLNMLSTVIDENIDNVRCAVDALEKLELIEILEDKTIYMKEMEKLIGSETYGAERKREYRENTTSGTLSQNCPLDNRVKSIDIRVKKESKKVSKKEEPSFNDVIDACITDAELNAEMKEYVKQRLLNKNKLTNHAIELACKKVLAMPKDKQLIAVRNSVINCWKGIFEPKEDINTKSKEAYIKDVENRTKPKRTTLDMMKDMIRKGVVNGTNGTSDRTANAIEDKCSNNKTQNKLSND